jgi:hypothetical protein
LPGYKALPDEFSGPTAEQVRYAEVLQRAGDPSEAVRMLEMTLDVCARARPELPGWLCGRLAALYRALKRYDDEVRLLERYRESQTSEEARSRFDARLSKARAIAERKRRTDTHALASVRRVINGGESDDVSIVHMPLEDDGSYSNDAVAMLRAALVRAAGTESTSHDLSAAVGRLCTESREREHPPERLVAAVRAVWRSTPRPPLVTADRWLTHYREAIARSLALYFDEPAV